MFAKSRFMFSLKKRSSKQRGVVALETALLMPVFLYFMMGIIEFSLMMLAQHVLENATYNSSRMGKTGYVPAGQTQLQAVSAALMTELGGMSPLIDLQKVTFTTQAYGALGQISAGVGAAGLGNAGDLVVYTVSYPWHFFTPFIGQLMGDENSTRILTSRMVVKNEPYT